MCRWRVLREVIDERSSLFDSQPALGPEAEATARWFRLKFDPQTLV